MEPSHLRAKLEKKLLVSNRHILRWKQQNKPPLHFIYRVLYFTFEPLMMKYPDSIPLFEKTIRVLHIVMKTGMNVPFPDNFSEYMHTLFDNVIEMYMAIFFIPIKNVCKL